MGRKNSESSHEHDIEEEDQITIEEQVQNKIKELGTLAEKVQAIALNSYLIQKRELDKKLEGQVNKIEVKHRKTYEPYLQEIFNIAGGLVDLTDEDLEGVEHLLTEQEKEVKKNYYPKKSIQDYWFKSFISSDAIAETVQPDDEGLLKHLVKMEATRTQDGTNFTVVFHFSQNQWIENQTVKKQFEIQGDQIKRSFGDSINWKAGKNLTVEIVKKKNKKKKTTVTKQVQKQSFFNLFKEIDLTEDNQQEQEQQKSKKDDEDEDLGEVEKLERQYEICNAIYQQILPRSLQFYLGVVGAMDFQDLMDLGEVPEGAQQQQDDEEATDKTKKKSKSKSKKRKGSSNSKEE